jgi:Mg-chelatase subunit ChlD
MTLRPFAAALALLAGVTAAPAHDWPSPPSRTLVRPAPPVPLQPWPGLLWAGPQAGMPAAPGARDCARPPQRFVLSDGQPQSQAGDARDDPAEATPGRRLPAGRLAAAAADAAVPSPASPPAMLGALRAEAAAPPSAARASRVPPSPSPAPQSQPDASSVTAGVVDDNADFGTFQDFLRRHAQVPQRPWDVAQRVRLDVRDGRGRPVPDARVEVFSHGVPQMLAARTDAAGRAWLMPQSDVTGQVLDVRVSHGASAQTVRWQRGQRDALQVRLNGADTGRARLDLVFAIDATGSMADEIAKLKASMHEVAERIAALPQAPDLCFGLVAYRDRGDAFFVRGADLTQDLAAFQAELAALQAGGGGDYPEAMAEALHTAVHRLSWRGEGTARLLVLLADAPPQRRPEGPHVDHEARAALARGVKIVSVGASGLDREGEIAMRQVAQATGGRFVFLTYANRHDPRSGPGRETVHDVRDYSVETLDKLIVRLVRDELAAWPSPRSYGG